MAQSSARKRASLAPDPAASYPVIDVVEVKVSYGAPAPGFILVPDGFRPTSPESLVGEIAVIWPLGTPGNRYPILATIIGVRDHGTTTSLLVEDWPADFPPPKVGWSIQVPNADGPAPGPPRPKSSKDDPSDGPPAHREIGLPDTL